MSPEGIAQIITALSTMVVAIGTLVISWRNSAKLLAVADKVETIHKATNSMKDELVAEVRKSAHAEGVLENKAEVKAATDTTIKAKAEIIADAETQAKQSPPRSQMFRREP